MNEVTIKKLIEERRQEMLEGKYKSSRDAATYESVSSQLPGRLNGPADAYRHMIWIAETTRRNKLFLGKAADKFTNTTFGHSKEIVNILQGSNKPEVEMDLHNNNVALKIGIESKSYEEVIQKARRVIEVSDGAGNKNSAKWLPENKWDKNPKQKKIDTQGKPVLNEKGKQIWEDVPREKLNWGAFDWVNKVNYKDTNNEQDEAYNFVRKSSLKAYEKVEEKLNNLIKEDDEPKAQENRFQDQESRLQRLPFDRKEMLKKAEEELSKSQPRLLGVELNIAQDKPMRGNRLDDYRFAFSNNKRLRQDILRGSDTENELNNQLQGILV